MGYAKGGPSWSTQIAKLDLFSGLGLRRLGLCQPPYIVADRFQFRRFVANLYSYIDSIRAISGSFYCSFGALVDTKPSKWRGPPKKLSSFPLSHDLWQA